MSLPIIFIFMWLLALHWLVSFRCIDIDHEQRMHYQDLTHDANMRDLNDAYARGDYTAETWRVCEMRWAAYESWRAAVFGGRAK